ncbi:MAG: phosphate ABC transporter substrate-binding protein [Clostridia bacterium]|nr:phosphate ABC transporter substrate-binding protein [Clostridia bacterium]
MALCLLTATGCGNNSEKEGHSRVIIAGSTSVQPYAELLEEAFAVYAENTLLYQCTIDIQGGGSAAGLTAAETNVADIGMSSRELRETEKEQLPYIFEIAKDGLAIIVHPSNPVANLTTNQLRQIYTQETKNWSELGGNDAAIHVITREDGSGTRSAFEELVMGKTEGIHPKAIVQNSNGAVRLLVSDDPNAIGFISLGLIEAHEGQKEVKSLKLEGIDAIPENVKNGTYQLSRPFIFAAKTEPAGVSKDFIDFIFSPAGKAILAQEGLIV